MRKILGVAGLAALALALSACSSSGSSSSATSTAAAGTPAAGAGSPASSAPAAAAAASSASGATLGTKTINGTAVVTDSQGMTLYWFVPDTSTTSKCTGSCATYWPPLTGPVTAGAGVTGTLGTITRPGGATQATYDGHPLYTYAGDTAPGQAKGNGLNVSGGLWYEMTVSGAKPATSTSTSTGGSGGGTSTGGSGGGSGTGGSGGGSGTGGGSGSGSGGSGGYGY
jgi:predicted lipoprotein with Yx(FWY)xxD motif